MNIPYLCRILSVVLCLGICLAPVSVRAQEVTAQMVQLFDQIGRDHQDLADEVRQFFTALGVNQESNDVAEVWRRHDELTVALLHLRQRDQLVVKDIQSFSRTYFEFCLAIDKVTDRHEVPYQISDRLGKISDTLKDVAALLEQ